MKTMLTIIWSVAIAVAVFVFTAAAATLFDNGGKFTEGSEVGLIRRKLHIVKPEGWIGPILLGIFAGLLHYLGIFLKTIPAAGISVLIAQILLVAIIVWWWFRNGSTAKELFFVAVAVFVEFMSMRAVAAAIKAPLPTAGIRSLVGLIPWVVLVLAIGLMVINALHYYNKNHKGPMQWVEFAAIVVLIVVLVLLLIFGVKWGNLFPAKTMTTSTTTAATTPTATDAEPDATVMIVDGVAVPFPQFQNAKLQEDDDAGNDYNFGPNPYLDGTTETEYASELEKRMKVDPALGAAVLSHFDRELGTKFLGVFYNDTDEVKAINAAKEFFIDTPEFYNGIMLKVFFKYLSSTTVEVWYADSGLDDQMYMNPYTVDGAPDVIRKETLNHSGHILVFTSLIKERAFKVGLRIECGFQPTTLAGTPVTEVPVPVPEPEPEPEPEPTPKKDPSKSPPMDPNDDPGPGPDTNNPDDPWHSILDQPENSDHMESYEEYREWMDELKDINDNQKVAGDPNTPTIVPEPDATVDNNGDKGTGYGGADDATPVSPPAKTEDGEQISSEPGKQWSGPPL